MRLLSWNINSVRLRLPQLLHLVKVYAPDIIALQETKCEDIKFPEDVFNHAGFPNQHLWGMKSYNGLAILSKTPFISTKRYSRCNKNDCRHISVQLEKFELHNLYIPSGGAGADEPDPFDNPKYQHKLDFVDELSEWFPRLYSPKDRLIAVGDFNIAPFEQDVWSHRQLLNIISHTPAETSRLNAMRLALDWIDTGRYFIPMEKKSYTWWSYRNRDWKKSNRGRRLDHIWATSPLKDSLKAYDVLTHARDFEKPSDHAPVILDLDF